MFFRSTSRLHHVPYILMSSRVIIIIQMAKFTKYSGIMKTLVNYKMNSLELKIPF